MASSSSRVRRPASRAAVVAVLGITFTLVMADRPVAGRDVLRQGRSSSTSTGSSDTTTSVNSVSAQTAATAKRAQETLLRAAQALKSVQSLQSAARTTAAASTSSVPNGLTSGGLVPDSGATASGQTVWTGASLPTQTVINGKTLVTVTQNDQQAVLNWDSFNIGRKTTLYFNQSAGGTDSGEWIVFNKINDPSGIPSKVLGSILAEGQVYVINQNGIIFGGESQVNVHALVASALPINTSLITSGILDNTANQFLFSTSYSKTTGGAGGDVVVEAGAQLTSPTTSDHVGGKMILVGENVTNKGTIYTPDGQTILAAGEQVGFTAHNTKDSSLRGLDVYIGSGGGTVENSGDGLINAPRASVTMAGKTVNQLGVIRSTTSVSLNGRIDLLADYDSISQSTSATSGLVFLPKSVGVVTLGAGSVTEILPETDSTETVASTALTLTSLINIQGRAIHLGSNALILAPGASAPTSFKAYDAMGATLTAGVTLSAGEWNLKTSSIPYTDAFVTSGGQIYLDAGASINVAGLTDVSVALSENIITAELRGSELADSVVQRTGVLRGSTVTIDARVGTSLADVSGYIDLIERKVSELSVNGGSVSLSAGESVVLQKGSTLDVSGGWISYTGGTVKTSRLLLGNNIIDIADASSDLVYSGVYSGYTKASSKWGVSATYTSALLTGSHYESSYESGGNGGSITITAPAMVLDGTLYGNTVTGERQRSDAPTSSSLTLKLEEQKQTATNTYTWVSPALAHALDQDAADPTTSHPLSIKPLVVLASSSDLQAADAFALSASGEAVALREDRRETLFLTTGILNKNGFGNLTIDNSDGDILLPTTEEISGVSGGSLTLSAANITLNGKITMAGGSLAFSVYDYSPLLRATELDNAPTPSADLTRGVFTLGSTAKLDVSGVIVDDRSGAADADTLALVTNGGSVTIKGYDVELGDGSIIDVSGGVAVSEKSKITYGDAGSITIESGRDPSIAALVGGKLHLGATLLGYAGIQDKTVSYTSGGVSILGANLNVAIGRSGGSLSILAPLIQIGGSASADSDVLYLDPDFFNQGGFSTFTLSGLGEAVTDSSGASVTDPTTGEILYKSALTIAADITPTVSNQIAVLGEAGAVTLQTITLSESLRDSVSLTFKALGVKDGTKSVPLVARGDLVLEQGVTIDAGLLGSVTLSGNTVDVLGSIVAQGGSITLSGATNSSALFAPSNQALATVVIGSHSVLDVSGALMLIDDVRGYRSGAVLEGGDITVSGNIVASAGAVLDVSGASGVLDLPRTYSGGSSYLSEGVSPVPVVATLVASDAGTITLTGGQELYSDATLIGNAGGSSAQGGSLVVSSGYFESTTLGSSVYAKALLPTLVVTQSGLEIATSYYANGKIGIGAAISGAQAVYDYKGNAINGLGHFTADTFTSGGFDSLTLKGTVLFQGDVSIGARSSLTVADGGVIYGTSSTTLRAPHVTLGASVLATPKTQAEYLADYTTRTTTGQTYAPTYGSGVLTVMASLIDIGNLSLRDIGKANFIADGGDIRGCGTLDVAGDIYLRAGQIYPPTASSFTIAAYDHSGVKGSVTIAGSGTRATPLSAGGELNVYASIINQGGVLRAPLGTINLGWSGADTVTGQSMDLVSGSTYATTQTVSLLAGSLTSVSAGGLTLPYGLNVNGAWIDPTGTDITTSGPPAKTINVTGVNIDDQAGSVIDLSGGGDLYAYTFTSGTGGSSDVLLSSKSFAVIPGYSASYAAASAYSTTATTLGGDTGYTNSSLKVGDCVYLNASSGLAAGYYILLPARYALLDGASLVTLKSGKPTAATTLSDGSTLVSGYKTNSLNRAAASTSAGRVYAEFEVASSSVVRARSEYTDYSGNKFFAAKAVTHGTTTPRLALDAGRLVLQATQSLSFAGSVLSEVARGGRGSLVDISSPSNIVIAGDGVAAEAGTLVLSTTSLNAIGADSLLIGGLRSTKSDGVHIDVTAETLTVDNEGAPLTGKDIILVANKSLTMEDGAEIEQAGSLAGGAVESVKVGGDLNGDGVDDGDGDGLLVRVSADTSVGVSRSGIPTTRVASLSLGSGVRLSAKSLTLDSSYAISLDPSAALLADAVALHSGQISLEFNGQGVGDLKQTSGKTTGGLVLSGDALRTLMASVKTLSLLSYSSIDLYGTGQVGDASFANLSLHAAQIRGFNNSNVTFAAQTITLDNSAGVSAPVAVDGQSSTLEGTLTFNGKLIELGDNRLDTGHYSRVALNASGALVATGKGALSVAGNLAISAPLITGAKAANLTVSAGGNLTATTPGGTGDTSLSGLGATLVLQGASVNVDTKVWLPSGDLTLYATGGDVQVGGTLDVGGTYKDFYDVIKYTNAGEITLKSDSGKISLEAGSLVNVAAQSGAGDAGTLIVKAPNGNFTAAGTLQGSGGTGGDNGTFSLDVGSLAHTASLDAILNAGGFTASRTYRVRTGDVQIDGLAQAANYRLSSDEGGITVTSTIDASGAEGGSIFLAAHGSLILKSGALLTVAADDFNSAGEGGLVTLEAGDSTLDASGHYTYDTNAVVDIQTGSTIDLSVASATSTSASLGDFTGILHLRAPQNTSQTDVQINPINGKVVDASVIIVEGYRVYNAQGGAISSVLPDILANGKSLVGAAGSASAGYYAMLDRLVQNNSGIKSLVSIRPGAEIVNANSASGAGDLTLGTTTSTSTSDLDLSSYRFGPKSAPGILTLRAAGSIYLYNSISDGFTSSAYTAELLAANSLLPANAQSWSYRIVSGADFTGADFSDVEDLDDLNSTTGSVLLGKYSTGIVSGGANALTSTAVKGYYQVIRTGSGDIDIYAGRSVKLLNQFATIYTAGTRVTTPTTIWTTNDFDLPVSTLLGTDIDTDLLGAIQQSKVYKAQYSMGGGDVVIKAQEDIKHETLTSAGRVAEDSERQLPTNWLYRRGYVDSSTGLFGTSAYGEIASTTWWVDYSNFFEGVGALGGGNVTMIAGHDIVNVDAVIPTNARMPKGTPDASKLLELGGGDLLVRAGHDISAGVYYVERGNGVLSAGNSIITNSTRYPASTAVTALSTVDPKTSYSWLPTTLFLGKGSFEVEAVGDLLMGPVVNAFLMPAGYSNSYLYKSYFSTYDTSDSVSVTSLTGDVTLRESTTPTTTTATSGGTSAVNILQTWLDKVLRYSKTSVSFYQPWLRLDETNVTPFATATSLMPGTLLVTAFSGDINVVGTLNLSPAPTGTVDILSAGSINGLNVNGVSIVQKVYIDNWGTGSINLSDADPSAVPSVESPYAYQELKGVSPEASDTEVNFLRSALDNLFAESGSTVGSRGSLETRQALHAAGILHEDDDTPVHIYAESGAISGLTLYSGKASQIIAGTDITDIALYIQNVRESDVSIVSAGRDIIAYDASSSLRQIISAALATNKLNISDKYPLTGDIQISGPGTLEVLAGRDLDLGDVSSNPTLASDLGLGITSIGNARNPYLSAEGADIIAAAGLVGSSIGLNESALDVQQFVAEFLNPTTSGSNASLYLSDVRSILQSYLSGTDLSQASDDQLWSAFNKLSASQQSTLVLRLFYTIMRDAGRYHSDSTSPDYQYKSAYAAIAALFPGDHWSGDISLASREIKTLSGVGSTASNGDSIYTGGNISLLAPGGEVIVGYDTATTSTKAADQGIITEHGGQISIFSNESVSVGTTRIFTLRGGDIIIWSTLGDIAAGSSSKTVKAASPTRVVIDPQSANVKTDLSGLATGGGIGVLATVAGIAVGSVDLVAPSGNIDAGDAGIRATGNLYVAALQILNAGNIQVGGASTGTPTAAAAPNIGNLTSASNAAGSALNSSASVANQATAQSTPATGDEIPSIVTVEVIGYGGGDEDEN